MTFKNSVKILFSNFNLVWKMALYYLISFVVLCFLGYLLVTPVIDMINGAGFFNRFVDLYTDFLTSMNLTNLFDSIAQVVDEILNFIMENMSRLWFSFLGIGLLIFVVSFFVSNIVNMACCNSLHLYMGSMTKQGFFTSLTDNLGKNFKFLLVYYLFNLPVNAIGIAILYLILQLFNISWILSLIAIFLIIIGVILFMGFKFTLFSAWVPTIVVMNYGTLKSFRMALKTVFRRFGRIFGTAIGVAITVICLNIVLALCSFMVGLLISIPISFLLFNVFGMVVVYEGQGMRYYVDIYNVITPKKKEDRDKLKDMIHIV